MRGSRVIARRLAIVAACVVSLLGACLLAWWQWNRYESASGTWQNLGYVLQWPLFGLFPAFMVWRVRRLKAGQRAGAGPAAVARPPGTTRTVAPKPESPEPVSLDARTAAPAVPGPRRRPVAVAPAEPDDELAAYNRYLAELNTKDQTG